MRNHSINNFTLCAGIGYGEDKITAFDRALIDASVCDYNIIKISSILPPKCFYCETISLPKGLLLPSAFSYIYSNQIGDTISAAVAVGIPCCNNEVGVIMKYCAHDNAINAEEKVRELAKQAMMDRNIQIEKILSISKECIITTEQIFCSFATVCLW